MILYKYSNPKTVQRRAYTYLGKDAIVYKSTNQHKKYMIHNMEEFNKDDYTSNSLNGQDFSSIGSSTNLVDNENLKSINFMMCGYLLADVLENIIFPKKPEFVNTRNKSYI